MAKVMEKVEWWLRGYEAAGGMMSCHVCCWRPADYKLKNGEWICQLCDQHTMRRSKMERLYTADEIREMIH